MVLLRTAGCCLLAGALLAGCGSDGEESAAETSSATAQASETAASGTESAATAEASETAVAADEVPEGYRRVEDIEAGFTLLLPERWRDVPFSSASADMEAFLEENPQMQAQVGALTDQGGLLLALDPDDQGVTNVNLLAQPSRAPLSDEIEAGRAQLEAAGARNFQVEEVSTAGGDAQRVSYELPINTPDGGQAVLQQQQYFLQSNTTTYALTLTTNDLPANAEELTVIGESFALLDDAG